MRMSEEDLQGFGSVRDARHHQILLAALDVYVEQGYAAADIDEVGRVPD